MRILLVGLVAGATAAGGADSFTKVTGLVKDDHGRPLTNLVDRSAFDVEDEDVKVLVCGQEWKLAEGSWARNRTPHCMLPKVAVDKAGRFTVPLWNQREVRFNLWVSKPGLALTFVTVAPQTGEVAVVLKRGVQVSGHVNRRVNGKLEPVPGTNVYLQCASGDAAHQKRLFDEPYLTGVWLKEGDDRPYQEHRVTGALGEYVFEVSPPPKDKKWFLICLDEVLPLDVKEGQPVKGQDFEVAAQVVETGKKEVPPAAPRRDK